VDLFAVFAIVYSIFSRENCTASVPCGIFDDPAIVAEIKQAAETIRKAMTQSNDLHSGLTAANSAQELNQMVRIINRVIAQSFLVIWKNSHLYLTPSKTTLGL
jgi:hypothetical protein